MASDESPRFFLVLGSIGLESSAKTELGSTERRRLCFALPLVPAVPDGVCVGGLEPSNSVTVGGPGANVTRAAVAIASTTSPAPLILAGPRALACFGLSPLFVPLSTLVACYALLRPVMVQV